MAAKKSPASKPRRLDPDNITERFQAAADRYAGRRTRRRAELSVEARAVFLDRLEALYIAGWTSSLDQYLILLRSLLPEDFAAEAPTSPGSTDPSGSPARVAEYQARADRGEPIVRSADVDAVKADRLGVAIRLRDNGHGFRTIGWTRPEGPTALPAGMYRDREGKYFELD